MAKAIGSQGIDQAVDAHHVGPGHHDSDSGWSARRVTMSGRGTATASGKSPAAKSTSRSCGRRFRSHSISRVAAGRFTLAIHHDTA